REWICRALETSGFRATYVTDTLKNARERAWENDTKSGFADVMRQLGEALDRPGEVETVQLAGMEVRVLMAELALDFSNGSRIDLFGADNLRGISKKRGAAKHVVWIDEAQHF